MKFQKFTCLGSSGLLILTYLFLPSYKYFYFLLWLFPMLGALITRSGVLGWDLDKKCRFHIYNLPLGLVAFGLGGALAGLPFSAYMITGIVTDSHEALATYEAQPDFRLPPDESEAGLKIAALIVGCGQLSWLIWPLAILEIYNRDHLKLAEFFYIFKFFTFFWAMFGLIPGFNLLPIFAVLLIANMFC